MKKSGLFLTALFIGLLSCPPQWYPMPVRLKLTEWFGASGYRSLPASKAVAAADPELFCPPDPSGWRKQQTIENVLIGESKLLVILLILFNLLQKHLLL